MQLLAAGWRTRSLVNNDDFTAATCMQRDSTCYICGKSVNGDEGDLKCTYINKPFQCTRVAHAACVESSEWCAVIISCNSAVLRF